MHGPRLAWKAFLFWILFKVMWRFLSGNHLDGNPRTDAGWFVRGKEIVNKAKYPRPGRWSYLPRMERALIRLGCTLTVLTALVGWLVWPEWFARVAAILGVLTAVYASWRVWKWWGVFAFRRHTLSPFAQAASPMLGLPPAVIDREMLYRDGWLKLPVPPHFTTGDGKMADLLKLANQRIGGEWKADVQVKRLPYYVLLTRKPEPRNSVTYADMLPYVIKGRAGNVFLGLGSDDVAVYADIYNSYPHIAGSMGTGAGKSSFLRSFIAQESYHGVDDWDLCDVKQISLAGMENVPGFRIHRSVHEIWKCVAEVRSEMERRYEELLVDPNKTFKRRYLILEEMNAFASLSKVQWQSERQGGDPQVEPFWNDLKTIVVMSRQVGIHVIGMWQLLLAAAAGGDSTIRTQFGLKILSRFDPQAWDLLVGARPRESSSSVPGRAVAVMEGERRRFQMPYLSVDDAMALVKMGAAYKRMKGLPPNPKRTRQQRVGQ